VDRPGGTSTTPNTVVDTPEGAQLQYSPGRIDPTSSAFNNSRKPLAGEFLFNGNRVFVIANHFNSKGGDQPLFGTFQPPTRSSEVQRQQQAQIVADFVRGLLAADTNANVVVLGDLNDFEFSPAVTIMENAGLTALIERLPKEERYTYVFEGNSQVLDYTLVSVNLLNNLNSYDVVHVNAEYVNQISDHDPQVARFTLVQPNHVPGAADDTYIVDEDMPLNVAAPGVLGNDTDADTDALSAVLVSGPSKGTVTLSGDGSFEYTPGSNFNGTDSFTYKANDGMADSNVATVIITVNAVNDAPEANIDVASAAKNGSVVIPVLNNDRDVDNDTITITSVSSTNAKATVTVNTDGTITYKPKIGFRGTDTFTYTISDGKGGTDTAPVTVTVRNR
jgi:hypothetical protein